MHTLTRRIRHLVTQIVYFLGTTQGDKSRSTGTLVCIRFMEAIIGLWFLMSL